MKKVIKLTESDLARIVKKSLEQQDKESYKTPDKKENALVENFKQEIKDKLMSGGGNWAVVQPNPKLKRLINGIRRTCDEYEKYYESLSE